MTKIIESLCDISQDYDAVFCDLWGCLHNGVEPFEDAVKALEAFQAKGGHVLLMTNSPRPKSGVISQLRDIGIPKHVWHEIASSGDSARFALASGAFGHNIYHLGPDRDLEFFAPGTTEFLEGLKHINRVPLEDADAIICTGLFEDNVETPDDYRDRLLYAKNKGLKFLCANPDIVVDRGEKRVYCAGALAALYTELGGESLYYGKPHPPIYDLARTRMTQYLSYVVPDKKILCIGDGIITDVLGAMGEDIDCLFVTGGLAAAETGTQRQPQPALLDEFLKKAQMSPRYSIGFLR